MYARLTHDVTPVKCVEGPVPPETRGRGEGVAAENLARFPHEVDGACFHLFFSVLGEEKETRSENMFALHVVAIEEIFAGAKAKPRAETHAVLVSIAILHQRPKFGFAFVGRGEVKGAASHAIRGCGEAIMVCCGEDGFKQRTMRHCRIPSGWLEIT